MTAKKQIISMLDTLESPQLLKILDYILSMGTTNENIRRSKGSKAYLRVRKALKNIKTDLSQEIMNDRQDRI